MHNQAPHFLCWPNIHATTGASLQSSNDYWPAGGVVDVTDAPNDATKLPGGMSLVAKTLVLFPVTVPD